jgi:hypothetical protein
VDEQNDWIVHCATIVAISNQQSAISNDMTRLGYCTDLWDKAGIRHGQAAIT